MRERVTKALYERGYSGTYPCFVKDGKLGGIHFLESHGQLFTVVFGKRLQSRVCFFEASGGHPELMIDSGIAFLKENEVDDEFFSYAFAARDKRYFAGNVYVGFGSTDEELRKQITIAAKKAELKRLTREERKEHCLLSIFPWWLIPAFIIIVGGFFFIGMSLISMLAALMVNALGWTTVTFTEFVVSFPWLNLAVLSLLACGGAAGIIMAFIYCFSRRK